MQLICVTILLALLFIGWIFLELRCDKFIRLSFGIVYLAITIIVAYITISSTGAVIALHHIALIETERVIADGDSVRVKKAISAYRSTYDRSGSSKAAATAMLSVLQRTDKNDQE